MDQRVKVNSPRHTYEMGIAGGLNYAVLLLKDLPENLRATPGLQLAIATVQAAAADQRASAVSRNLAMLAKNGIDVAVHKAVSYDAETDELTCELYSPEETA